MIDFLNLILLHKNRAEIVVKATADINAEIALFDLISKYTSSFPFHSYYA
jgi:hypothetical protein